MGERPLPSGYGGSAALQERLSALLARGGERDTIGQSREGRPVHAYRWGNAASPGVLVISLLHPMEWIGLEAHLAFLEALLDDEKRERGVFSIPVANPDGFARVEHSLREGEPHWVRGNAARVDLNRNFPVGHRARPPLLDWWPLYGPGPAALSEPETEAIVRWIRGRTVERSLSLHSFGRKIFVPPARSWRPLADTAATLAAARAAALGSGYGTAQLGRWSPLLRVRGCEIDFLRAETGAPAFLLELSRGGFGRWGLPGLLQPFCLFNPPRPQEEIARVLPVLLRLARGVRLDPAVSPSTPP